MTDEQNNLIIVEFIREKVDSLYNNVKLLERKERINLIRLGPSIEDCKKVLDALVVLKNNVGVDENDETQNV